jgi:hypothetical protein
MRCSLRLVAWCFCSTKPIKSIDDIKGQNGGPVTNGLLGSENTGAFRLCAWDDVYIASRLAITDALPLRGLHLKKFHSSANLLVSKNCVMHNLPSSYNIDFGTSCQGCPRGMQRQARLLKTHSQGLRRNLDKIVEKSELLLHCDVYV